MLLSGFPRRQTYNCIEIFTIYSLPNGYQYAKYLCRSSLIFGVTLQVCSSRQAYSWFEENVSWHWLSILYTFTALIMYRFSWCDTNKDTAIICPFLPHSNMNTVQFIVNGCFLAEKKRSGNVFMPSGKYLLIFCPICSNDTSIVKQ